MQIIRDAFYLSKLDETIDYMAKNSLTSAILFLDNLDNKINNLPNFPYKFRESNYHDNKNIRDLIFQGYTIPYLVDIDNKMIIILDIFKWNHRKIVLK